MLAREGHDGARHESVPERRQAGYADGSCADLLDLGCAEPKPVEANQIGLYLGMEQLAFSCWHQSATDSIEQLEAELGFKFGQRPTDRWLRCVEQCRRRAGAAGDHDCVEDINVA